MTKNVPNALNLPYSHIFTDHLLIISSCFCNTQPKVETIHNLLMFINIY